MASYRIVDQTQKRVVKMNVDPHMKMHEIVPQLIAPLKLSLVDFRGQEMIYLLSYQGRFLGEHESLASAGVPDGDTIDLIGNPADLGAAGFERHAREWDDYEELLALHEAHRDLFDLELRGKAYDDAPLGYRLTFKGIAGPIVDPNKIQRNSALPLLDANNNPRLNERFVVDIYIMERYPFVEPQFFYVDPILFHPNVNAYSRKACLYEHWRPINNLVDVVERFIVQISYLAPPASGVHLLNSEAYEWMQKYRSAHPEAMPFKNKAGQGPPALQKQQSAASGLIEVIETDEEITIRKS